MTALPAERYTFDECTLYLNGDPVDLSQWNWRVSVMALKPDRLALVAGSEGPAPAIWGFGYYSDADAATAADLLNKIIRSCNGES